MWIARDKCGSISIYTDEPIKYIDRFVPYDCDGCRLNSDMFPEVTFENSPKELVIKD